MRNIPGLEFETAQFQTLAAAFPRRKRGNEMARYDCPVCGVESGGDRWAGGYLGGVIHEVAGAEQPVVVCEACPGDVAME